MRHLKHIIILIVTSHLYLNAVSQNVVKPFIGTWKPTQVDSQSYSITEETWIFKNAKSGVWNRRLSLSGDAVVCFLKNPFIWQINKQSKIKIIFGKTECKCTASQSKFENGLDEFANNLKANSSDEISEYKYRIVDSSLIYFDKIKLVKQ